MSLEDSMKQLKIKGFEIDGFDASQYTKKKIYELSPSNVGEKIAVFGWVITCRDLKNYTFIELSSHFKTIKLVIPGTYKITFTTSLLVYGTVVAVKSPKDEYTFELYADKFQICNDCLALSFPLNSSSDKDTVLDEGHLALRSKERTLFLQARSALLRAIREHFFATNHTEITPPTIVQTQVEGGSTLFKMDYYGEAAYLTQSSQLYLETVAPVAGSAFCIMPSYRAEKSKTSRHLSEYTHVEAELVDIDFNDLMSSIEALVRESSKKFYDAMLPGIKKVYPNFEPIKFSEESFKRLSYKDAIDFLISKNHMKTNGTPYSHQDDICDASEKFIVEEYGKGQPVFLINFPEEFKPFYVRKENGETQSCDLLFPGIGETVGGSMRCDDYTELVKGFEREGLNTKAYKWYLDLALYGPSMHGGYGLGFERLMMGLMKYKNVDEATLYPRKVSRCKP